MSNTQNDPKWTNEVKIAGILASQQITPTFTKQVLKIRAKDTKDQQWKDAEIEIYIKPEILQTQGITEGDTILINGWLAFNFWNGRSFPRIVVTEVQLLEKGQGGAQSQQAQAQVQQTQQVQINQPQQVAQMPQNETQPNIPQVPPMPTM